MDELKPCPLSECPIGLFLCSGELCFKTEYGNNDGRIDAFIVSSGEFFWGSPPQTILSQRATIVQPVSDNQVAEAIAAWNRRPLNPPADDVVKRVTGIIRAARYWGDRSSADIARDVLAAMPPQTALIDEAAAAIAAWLRDVADGDAGGMRRALSILRSLGADPARVAKESGNA